VNHLYKHNSFVDELLELRLPADRRKLSGIKEFSRSLKSRQYDLGIILPDSFSSALIFRLGGVEQTVGYRSELRSFMLTTAIKPPIAMMHRSERYMELLRRSIGTEHFDSDISVAVSDRERNDADRLLAGFEKFAVICPTSRAPSRRWGDRNYSSLIAALASDFGFGIVLAGAADETEIIDSVGELSGVECFNLARENNILLSIEVMRRSEVFVGNDSGAAHLAAASGTRVISISGPDNPDETRPLAKVGAIVRKQIECVPCVKNICPRKDHVNECMDIISPDDVLSAVKRILKIEKQT
jgi:heptosyltransferase-2